MWCEIVLDYFDNKKEYRRRDIVDCLRNIKGGLSKSAYDWSINQMLANGELIKLGYDLYSLPCEVNKKVYSPVYSRLALELIESISKHFPLVKFTVFETVLLNEFLNHLVGNNTIFIQVEKESSAFVFHYLKDAGFNNVMYKPSLRDFDLYWTKDCVVVNDLISESPISLNTPHYIAIEKIVVDMLADRLVGTTYQRAEFLDVLNKIQDNYLLDKTRMLRYASRRNKKVELLEYLKGE